MRQIVASGGAGWPTEARIGPLEEYLLELLPSRPRILLLPTASGDRDSLVVLFHELFGAVGARTAHLAVFRPHPLTGLGTLLEQDCIYVPGGSTVNLMALWRIHGLPPVLRAAYEAGVVLAGVSAGAICWFSAGLSNSLGPGFAPVHGLGLLPGSFCPHVPADPERMPALEALVARGEIAPAWAVDDGTALHFANERLVGVAGGGRALRVDEAGSRPLALAGAPA